MLAVRRTSAGSVTKLTDRRLETDTSTSLSTSDGSESVDSLSRSMSVIGRSSLERRSNLSRSEQKWEVRKLKAHSSKLKAESRITNSRL
ncbi:hypothetical protein SYJ56_00010 [Algoriphagus sp. D3-2-R+10]|uniref:hypothetical protein n=1 Tax=Algoriphagus aurantiacus TaxID=3103948 RepID=UPI002B373083|nr:hypothetical protein [Algoriphagus sp. D3-2-R+10]MEB2773666.1 hypothetical protein [Algoriphagus sp. D3-2-R+10]